jgi:DNA-binding response OmpR family regulator
MAEPKTRILVVDDDLRLRDLLQRYLTEQGFTVHTVSDAAGMDKLMSRERFDLLVLDLMLPGEDGLSVCRRLRGTKNLVPIIMLTAKGDEVDKVAGLEMGADDYITKPFSVREFRSRVKAALRRGGMAGQNLAASEPIRAGGLEIDFERRSVLLEEKPVQLTYVEFEILAALAASPGRVYTREMLLEHIWGDSTYRDPRTVYVHIRHLREKLEADAKHPQYLFTVRGVGYRFRDADRD